MSESISIRALERYPDPDWNRFVDQHPEGQLFHLSDWGAVYAELSWLKPCFLAAERQGSLVGVMPLAEVRWGWRGKALVSAPYCVQAGPLAAEPDVAPALEQAALEYARRRRARFLEVRQSENPNPARPCSTPYASFEKSFHNGPEFNMSVIPRKHRAVIRKSAGRGLIAGESDDLQEFYTLYAQSVRNLGTPAFSRLLFDAVYRHLKPQTRILTVRDRLGVVTSVMSFFYKDWVMPYYAGGLPRARSMHAYDFMYWSLLSQSVAELGSVRFNFGRSLIGSGAYAFKKNWGFKPTPLNYQIIDIRGHNTLNPESRINRLARAGWSRLPLAVANTLGPALSRRLF